MATWFWPLQIIGVKVYLHLICERIIDHGPKYNEFKRQLHIWPWNFEPLRSRSQTKVSMKTTREGLSTFDVWKSYWPLSRYIEIKRQLHIWPWNLEHSRSRQQTKVTMERTHQGLSTSQVLKSYWTWCRYNKVKCQLHIWPWNLELSRSKS